MVTTAHTQTIKMNIFCWRDVLIVIEQIDNFNALEFLYEKMKQHYK